MRWFPPPRDPAVALVVDGVVWGAGVGFGLPALLGVLATIVGLDPGALGVALLIALAGTMVGTAVGTAVGLCGALAMAVCRRLHTPPGETALTTIAGALLGPVAVAELSGRDPQHSVLVCMVVAAGPLVLDVVRLVRRGPLPRHSARRSGVCGLGR